jgi:hypothetical protein
MKMLYIPICLLLLSCGTSKKVQSLSYSPEKEVLLGYNDPETDIQYAVSNDQENVHIYLRISDQMEIMKIMRGGLKFYFDIEGNKSRDVYLQYPQPPNQRHNGMNEPPNREEGQDPGYRNEMHRRMFGDALFVQGNEQIEIDVLQDSADVQVVMEMLGRSEMNFVLTLPFNYLDDDGLDNINKMSVGIVSGKMQRPSGMSSGRSRGSGPGGRRPGAGQPPGGGTPSGGNMSAMNTRIDFWFTVDLFKTHK